MEKKFRTELCSDLEYDGMVADIYYDDRAVGMVTQEEGADNMKFILYPMMSPMVEIPLDEFIDIIRAAKQRLIERG